MKEALRPSISSAQARNESNSRPGAAALSNPLYYLRNLQTVVKWVLEHHYDLLLAEELHLLNTLLSQDDRVQALFARMTMRKGDIFRSDALNYQEIGDSYSALQALSEAGFVDLTPVLNGNEVYQLCRRAELFELLQHWQSDANFSPSPLRTSSSKTAMAEQLVALAIDHSAMALNEWWPGAPWFAIALRHTALFERIRLMFFGNLYQDWSEFVLSELGYQNYERVDLDGTSRAFDQRDEVDFYLALHNCHSRLDSGELPSSIAEDLPPPHSNLWLENRRLRLLFTLARNAERQGEAELALGLYQQNSQSEAQVRYWRMYEKYCDPLSALPQLTSCLAQTQQPEARLHLGRVQQRLAKKAGQSLSKPKRFTAPSQVLTLAPSEERVEDAVVAALATNPALEPYYVENTLFPALLGLLLWPEIFQPLPGAFFNPFQAGPADLFRDDFYPRRQAAIDTALAMLNTDQYQQRIRDNFIAKQGLNCALVHWPALSQALLDTALACIPPQDLLAIFKHLLLDLRKHRSGMPDLIVFDRAQQRYELVEVKGPGDKLQDHQQLWISFFQSAAIAVKVCHVEWEHPGQ